MVVQSTTNYDYTGATAGLMDLLRYLNNYPALGTGIERLANQGHNLLGSELPIEFLKYQVGYQINLVGSYPTDTDVVPSAIFVAAFAVLLFVHLGIFIINCSRHHFFWVSIGWVFYCILRCIGFGLRIPFGKDVTRVPTGIASEVLLILPSIVLVSLNLILAQRVYSSYKKVVQASAVLILAYSLTAISLIGLAYFFKPTRKDENLYTYQPWWIESFSPFYFVKKGAVYEAEETFMKRNHNHRHAIRVIAATHHHYNMVEGLTNQRGDLSHNWSLGLIAITTLFIFVGSLCRLIVCFQDRYTREQSRLCEPVAMYILWGLLEVIINVLYIVGRVDLRFYRPDILPAKVRAIITAQQSIEQSDASSEFDQYSSEEEISDTESSEGFDLTPNVQKEGFVKNAKELESDDDEEFRF
ncbi:hypothetical protein CJJ09_005427 [Candidozyma auris]|nr:hypothetical protein CJJ09_005427 [[Candida] auris]